METALAILTLLNASTPGIAQLILLIKRNNGTVDVVTMLNEADAKFQENLASAKAWLESHPAV